MKQKDKKYYEEMEMRFINILDHATGSRMSKSKYTVDAMRHCIDEHQQEAYYSIVKDDLQMIIKGGGTLADVKKYIKTL
jgi:hypothetical protein